MTKIKTQVIWTNPPVKEAKVTPTDDQPYGGTPSRTEYNINLAHIDVFELEIGDILFINEAGGSSATLDGSDVTFERAPTFGLQFTKWLVSGQYNIDYYRVVEVSSQTPVLQNGIEVRFNAVVDLADPLGYNEPSPDYSFGSSYIIQAVGFDGSRFDSLPDVYLGR